MLSPLFCSIHVDSFRFPSLIYIIFFQFCQKCSCERSCTMRLSMVTKTIRLAAKLYVSFWKSSKFTDSLGFQKKLDTRTELTLQIFNNHHLLHYIIENVIGSAERSILDFLHLRVNGKLLGSGFTREIENWAKIELKLKKRLFVRFVVMVLA